jgi:hypothetical protein
MDFSPPTGQRFSRPDSETDRRRAGMIGLIFDPLIAEAADHALGKYNSVADGNHHDCDLDGWNYLIKVLS